jgi:hypothetical protein
MVWPVLRLLDQISTSDIAARSASGSTPADDFPPRSSITGTAIRALKGSVHRQSARPDRARPEATASHLEITLATNAAIPDPALADRTQGELLRVAEQLR